MKTRYPRIIIAGMRGGSGKTTVSLGIVAAWRASGLSVVPYKKGPDYIDAGWLASASGRDCFNLDPFLITKERIISSFYSHFTSADCAVIEGNRGLYDGMDASGTYSTAELAKMLGVPVILVVDCTKATRTAAAMVLGMLHFDRKVPIRGVVLNRIAGKRHETVIREAIAKYCKVPVLGAIPKLGQDLVSERHMGLTPFQEHPEVAKAISAAAEAAHRYLDLDGMLRTARQAPRTAAETSDKKPGASRHRRKSIPGRGPSGKDIEDTSAATGRLSPRIGIVRDSAFQFYYPENFEELRRLGAELVEVSALTARALPDLDALYIGGGFPETNALALAKNRSFRRSLAAAVEGGLPVYAECGGLMYLGEELLIEGKSHPMTGVFPISFSLQRRPQAHGYTVVEVTGENPFYRRGITLKGHEFHYSKVEKTGKKEGMRFSFRMSRGEGISGGMDGVTYKNVFATYTHLHAYGSPEWARGLVDLAVSFSRKRSNGAAAR